MARLSSSPIAKQLIRPAPQVFDAPLEPADSKFTLSISRPAFSVGTPAFYWKVKIVRKTSAAFYDCGVTSDPKFTIVQNAAVVTEGTKVESQVPRGVFCVEALGTASEVGVG